MSLEKSRRGRPQRHDVEELRERALIPLLRDGYENVTMAQIAAEVGGSVRTLHRYFPHKSDIVWSSLDQSFLALRELLAQADDATPVTDVLAHAVRTVFATHTENFPLTLAGLKLVATTPELRAAQPAGFQHWRRELAAFIAHRRGTPPDDIVAVATGAALQSTIMAGLEWWATHDSDGQPEHHVAAALDGLRELG